MSFIPPIFSNFSVLKLFRTDKPATNNDVPATQTTAQPADIIDISETARQRLDGVEDLSQADPGRLQEVISQTRQTLEDPSLTLGLDPDFS